jgi:hypothetical protein
MIRFINCLKRKPGMTPAEFRRYWDDPRFAGLIDQVVRLTGAKQYARHVTLDVGANDLAREMRGGREPYDGVLEYWWDSAAHVLPAVNGPEGRAIVKEMLDYQRQFVEFSASTAFFTES